MISGRPSGHVLEKLRTSSLVFVAISALAGCRSCANDHPYVPPATSASSSVTQNAAPPEEPAAPLDGGVEPAQAAPPGATSFTVDGVTIALPEREVVLALVRDFDGDGKKDALAIVRPLEAHRKPNSSTGELVFLRAGDSNNASVVASGPPLGVQSSCSPRARLEAIGPRSAFAEIASDCPRGAGSRAIIVARLAGEPSVAFDALVLDPREAPKLTVDVDMVDRDKDGLDDVVLNMAIAEPTSGRSKAPRIAAKLAFFDRPAGPSRDPEEPEASLRVIARDLAARASKAKEASAVPPLVREVRALYRAMCLEGGQPRIAKIHGADATPCGASKSLEEIGVAEVRAYVHAGDALRAYAAAAEVQLAPATKTAAKTTEVQKLLRDVAPPIDASRARVLSVLVDAARGAQPEWGPLAFEAASKLLVRHGKVVTRVDLDSGEEEETDIPPWRDDVLSPDGKSRLIEAYHACEGVALRATFAPTDADGDMAEVLLPIAPHLGKSCRGAANSRGDAASVTPIAWGSRGLEAIIAGQPVLLRPQPPEASPLGSFSEQPPMGSPLARSGKSIAVATSSGVLLQRGTPRWSLVKAPELEPYTSIRHCTANDDGSRVACLRGGKVVSVTLP